MSFSETWKNASTPIEPPAGNYKVKITRTEAKLSNAGDEKANVILEIIDGDLAGEKIDHFMWLAHEVSAAISKRALITYGLDDTGIDSIEALDTAMQKLVGRTAEISVSYKDSRMNVNVFRSAASTEQPQSDIPTNGFQQQPASAFAPKSDETVPF